MKIVFMGTPDFSATVLEKLHAVYPVCAVVTAPDKPAGRGYSLQPSPLKATATELGIPVLEYDRVSKDGIEKIRELAPDVAVTAAFGQILSEEFLAIPKHGVLNVHASLLPKYRGASPIQHAIIEGEKETGVTIMRTFKEVDAGDILLQKRVDIGEKETAGELFDRLAALGGEAIVEAIGLLENGEAEFVPQDAALATHCGMISKADGLIDFNKSARELDCFVRGMTPWPSAYTYLNGKTLKVFEVEVIDGDESVVCGLEFILKTEKSGGDIFKIEESGVVVAADEKKGLVVTSDDRNVFIRLKSVQLEGAKRMSDTEFLRGRSIPAGTVLGK